MESIRCDILKKLVNKFFEFDLVHTNNLRL